MGLRASGRAHVQRVAERLRRDDLMAEYYVVTDLGTLPGGASSNAWDINDNGQVVGSSDIAVAGPGHAFLWNPTKPLQDLGTLPGGTFSEALGINVCGMPAGSSDLTGVTG